MDLFGDFDWTEQAPAPVAHTDSMTPVAKSIEETEESLIESVLRGSSTQPEALKSATTSPDMATQRKTPETRRPHDIFAELKAKHKREEEERRQQEEAARKKMLEDSGDESDDDLTSLLV